MALLDITGDIAATNEMARGNTGSVLEIVSELQNSLVIPAVQAGGAEVSFYGYTG